LFWFLSFTLFPNEPNLQPTMMACFYDFDLCFDFLYHIPIFMNHCFTMSPIFYRPPPLIVYLTQSSQFIACPFFYRTLWNSANFNSFRATDRTFLLSPFTLNNHEERWQRWMLLLDKTRKQRPKKLQLPAFQIIARISAHVQSYKRRIYTWHQFFEIVNWSKCLKCCVWTAELFSLACSILLFSALWPEHSLLH
jgi:hypothetical protein